MFMLIAYLIIGFIFFNIWAFTTMAGGGGIDKLLLCFVMSLVWPLSLIVIIILIIRGRYN